uniref:(northern house mosquito) hypothetical protein n=1 Tax=Culex pipiens TaxID=7175 RepID=A0A8D8CPK5_CULPI
MPVAIPVIVRTVIAIVLIDQVPVQIPLRTAPAIPADVTLPAVRTRPAAAVPVPLVVVPFPKTQKDATLVRSTHPLKKSVCVSSAGCALVGWSCSSFLMAPEGERAAHNYFERPRLPRWSRWSSRWLRFRFL